MNIHAINKYTDYRPTTKLVQDLLDSARENVKDIMNRPVWCLQGLRFKEKSSKGTDYIVEALVDRECEVEIHLHKASPRYQTAVSVVSVKPVCKTYSASAR